MLQKAKRKGGLGEENRVSIEEQKESMAYLATSGKILNTIVAVPLA